MYELKGMSLLSFARESICQMPRKKMLKNSGIKTGVHVGVGLRQGCVLYVFLFIVYMNWVDQCSQVDDQCSQACHN